MVMRIRELDIDIPLSLAPMVGLSHSALRSLIAQLGGAGLFFTEMLSAKRLPSENEKKSPFLVRDGSERPLFFQIFTSTEDEVDCAMARLAELDAQGIDVNLGCPAPQLRKIGAGLELFKQTQTVTSLIKRMRRQTILPLSVKIRLGETEDSKKLLGTCQLFEDLGVDLITIHARLNGEKFCRKPRWHMLGNVTPKLSVPVIANGGIFSVDDARRCLEQSGAAGLMIGRGAVHNPWLFRDIAKELFDVQPNSNLQDGAEVYSHFITLLEQRFTPERRLGRLKQFTHYFASNYSFGHLLVSRIQNSSSMKQAAERAKDFFKHAA